MFNDVYARQLAENGFVPADHREARFFPVSLQPVGALKVAGKDTDGRDIYVPATEPFEGYRAVMREDTGAVLAVHSDKYQLVPREVLFNAFDQALVGSGLDLTDMMVGTDMSHGGARCFRTYVLPAYHRAINGADVALRIVMFDSYDGSTAFKGRIGFYNFVCANTAVCGIDIDSVSQKHIGEIDAKAIAAKLIGAVDAGRNQLVEMARWPLIEVDDRKAPELFKAVPGISNRVVDYLVHRWVDAKHDSGPNGGANVWAAYNVLTAWATHGIDKDDANKAATRASREGAVFRATTAKPWQELLAA